MTIGIAVLFSTKPKVKVGTPNPPVRPDGAIIIADSMGSTDSDSIDQLHKLYFDDAAKLYGTCAGRVEMAGELVSMFGANIKELPRKSHGTVWEVLNVSVHGHRVQHFTWDVLAQRHSFLKPATQGMIPVLPSDESEILREWQEYDTGAELLVATFDEAGQALLYFIGKTYDHSGASPGLVHLQQFPGHAAIGTGAYNAHFWLNYRQQTLGLNIRQSAYHAYEAKIMAAKAPTVNDNIEIAIATAEKSWYLSKEIPEQPGCEVSLLELEHMFRKYGPQNTYDLGHKATRPAPRRQK